MVPIKTENEILIMKNNGETLYKIIQELIKFIKPQITTRQIERQAIELFNKYGVQSAFKGYKGYPASICTSINNEVVHGIPSDRRIFEGDIISLDLGIFKDGYFADSAITIGVGKIESKLKKLIDVTKKALYQGIKKAYAGNHLYDISSAIQNFVESRGFSVVHQYVGHGIGRDIHEEPEIPNFGKAKEGVLIKEGMVFAIEPMVNMGTWQTKVLDDGWTAVTSDGLASAHFEHMVAITKQGPLILTQC